MLIITLQVNAPAGSAQAVKESLGMYLEHFGDVRVTSIQEVLPEQMRFDAGGIHNHSQNKRSPGK